MRRPIRIVAERLFAASLWLYPKPFRTRYGEEMRAVFAARLRDASNRSVSATTSMLTDALLAAGGAQCHAFGQRGSVRVAATLALLLFGLLGGVHRAQLAAALLDGQEGVRTWWKHRPMQTYRAFEREEQRRAAALLADGSFEQKLAAGLILSHTYSMGQEGQPPVADLLALVKSASSSSRASHLHYAMTICRRTQGCDWRATMAELRRRDNDNAAAWLLVAAAVRASDPAEYEMALRRAAGASVFRPVAAPAIADWLEWSATRPFEASWWQPEPKSTALALHYWRIEEALPGYGLACAGPADVTKACLAVARRWHGAADTQRMRAQLTYLVDRERLGRTPQDQNAAAASLSKWNRALSDPANGEALEPRTLARQLRTRGQTATISDFSR
jgi:hypothetical protein